jgi:hypothetical protein
MDKRGDKMKDIYEKLGLFYLGREHDIQTGKEREELLLVKNKNLTTHAAIIGMTGSGKTGLGIGIIEEAVLDKIPSLIIDPKGDMGNLLLAFDDFNPKSFEPWLDAHEAEKKGMDIPSYAIKMAETWQKGIESWGMDKDRVRRFKEGADFTIYTPGSSSGIQLSVLSSFDAPSADVLDDPDTFSYILNSTVSSILALVGIDADPLQSREYLLLTNIFNYFWKKEQSLTLESLIGHVTNPPFEKVGVLALKSFYPQNDRLKLAMLLNNVLASPTFSAWIEGEPLDIERLLFTDTLKPRVSILSIAHLNDNERMFFVTLLLNKYISWMRTQSGASSLKTLLYMDEIYGFFPATSNPPSKNPMLLLLKQARAFGVGVVLSTQNPVDLDYKGLSNIGSWFIGRLQTKQDVDRVIDGLIKSGSQALDKKSISSLLSNLKKRLFLFKSAHRDEIELFSTRWVMSYLKGPLSKREIAELMQKKKSQLQEIAPQSLMQTETKSQKHQESQPILSDTIDQFYYSRNPQEEHASYLPYLLANATVKFYDSKRHIDYEEEIYQKYYLEEEMKDIEWEEGELNEDDFELYDMYPKTESSFASLPHFILEAKNFKSLEKAFANYLYHDRRLTLYRYRDLKIESYLEESLQNFQIRAMDVIREKKEQEIEKIRTKFEKRRESFQKRHARALERLAKEEEDVSHSKTNALLSFGMTILDALSGRKSFKRSTTSKAGSAIRSASKMYREKDDVQRAENRVQEIEEEIYELDQALQEAIDKMDETYIIENFELEKFYIKPRRSDIFDLEMGLLWESR